MKKSNQAKKTGMVMLTICLLWLVACKRDQFQPPTPNVLNSYRGTDKIVLQVVEELKKPDNKALLAEIEKQGSINWEYQALITSRFLDGITLRFTTGSNGDYLDAEVNAETKAIGLFSKQQQQQRDVMAQQAFGNKPKGNSTQAGLCRFNMSFELAASPDLNILQFLTGLLNIRFFLEAQGFKEVMVSGPLPNGSPKIFYYYVVFEAINNETETEVRTLLRDAIAAFCSSIGSQSSSCWSILGLRTTSSCDYDFSNYDLSSATADNITVHVQAPFPPDILHKVDILDRRSLNRPLSNLMFSFKYFKERPTTITDFNFISTSIGIDYTLAEPMSVSSIIHSQNMINIRFKIKQSIFFNGFPFSNLYWCFISYNYYSESATVSYLKI